MKVMVVISPQELTRKGYVYYLDVEDWIVWDGDRGIDDKDGAWGEGWIKGIGITKKEYCASVSFLSDEPQLDTIKDIEEV